MQPPELIEFRPNTVETVLERMDVLARDHSGWINFQPGVPPDLAPPGRSSLFGLFSGRGPEVPVCTWTPGERRRRGVEPASVGIQHGTGPRVADRLRDAEWPIPEAWRRLMDHGKRGLVVVVPADTPHTDVLAWLLGAGERLSLVPVTGTWLASVHVA